MASYIPRILIVDDEPQICDSLKILLKRQGYDILTANSGREAVDLLASNTFDLLLLDMVIPDMNGFQIMDHVNRNNHDVLTIVITGNASIESAVTALRKGAYDYLKKPFEYEELLKRVGNALQQKKLAREKKIIRGKLERSEERYQFLVQNSPDVIYILDNEGCFTFVNVTVERLLGYDPDQLIGKPFSVIVHEESQDRLASLNNGTHARDSAPDTQVELKLKLYDDRNLFKLFEIEQSSMEFSTTVEGEKVFGTYGVARDITYRKQLEEQLQQAKKMEAIGTLAGGIAHDFNNILMGVMGYTSLMLSEIKQDDPYYSKLQSIEQHVRSGANLTKQLLGFARGRKYDVKPVDIHVVIDRTANMFGRTKKEIVLENDYQEDVWTVELDEGQMEQVLFNFYVNAWQAMPDGGTLTITTRNITVDEKLANTTDLRAGRYVTVQIRDTGIGMDEAVRQRVFEPFFTTKGSEKGTGLGLASAYGIVANHDGTITVQSKKGEGTVFTVYLPVSDKEVEKVEQPTGEIQRGSETVLLVDDEETMLDVGMEILEAIGYTALTASSGDEALNVLQMNKTRIDLAIVDLIMPGMGGGELCNRIREVSPATKLLLSSGYSKDGEAMEILQQGCNGFIQKPFAIKELSHKLREILDRDAPSA